MFLRYVSLVCLVLLISLVTSCPNGGNDENTGSGGSDINANSPSHDISDTQPENGTPTEGTDATDNSATENGDGTEGASETTGEGTTDGESEPAPPAWSIEGVKQGEPLRLSTTTENTIIFKFELPKECHWNENDPLGMAVTFAPDGIVVEPLEFAFTKPADVPSELVFKVKGVKAGGSGDLAFDVRAFFCSDEGFCLRKNDTVSLSFVTGESKEPAKYAVVYKLSVE